MKTLWIKLLATVALTVALGSLAACEDDDGALENAGEKMQDAGDDAGDAVEDALD